MRVGDDEEAINRLFTPEFRNRLDAVIGFNNLSPDVMGKVVDKFVMQLEAQLDDRNVTILLDDASRDWLAKKGYDPLFGARPLARVIQESLKQPLAEELLFGKLVKGGTVKVGVADGALTFDLEQDKPAGKSGKGGSGKRRGKKPNTDDSGGGEKEPALVEK